MPKEQSNQYMHGALILTMAAFIVKILSAVYRVPFQNIVGDVGFYIYQQVYPIYGIAAVLASSGFPVIISKLAAESEIGKRNHLAHSLQAAFLTLLLIGASLFSFFFFGATFISVWMGDAGLAPLVKISAFMFLFLPFLSIGRGYFQSVGKMTPTAISQVTEQLARVTAILLIAFLFVSKGYSLYEVGRGAVAGSIIGTAFGLFILAFFVWRYRALRLLFTKGLSFRKFYKTAQIVLIHGTAICLSGMLLILFQMIDSFSLYSLLVQSGISVEESKVLKGVFDRGQPLLQLGTVAASSFSLALVPLIASAWLRDDEDVIHQKAISAIKITTIIGFGAAIGLVNIMKPTNIMLFANGDGSSVLSVLAIAIFFSSIILICSGILQGLGHVFAPGRYIIVGLLTKITLNFLFIPSLSTMGSAIATIISLAVVSILMIKKLNKKVAVLAVLKKMTSKFIVAGLAMTVALQLWLYITSLIGDGRLINTFMALSSVMLGAGVFLVMIMKSHLLTAEEISLIPFGKRLVGKGRERK
ncbi:putative polysaccharide biosynthesis protein [Lederbergia panacisoli]|uniref:putative polysaccharide biosynthesis protein n=1 Tax=Lederbergia panacisoli TaxID=1255251 RepID=UPI00214AE9C1|nr:polysaccharide biosynthesis protein [Lederbergia panacisoli]MCR2823385.1 polysaccharide biosynthesis protein [Lederbergia panacisoli]